MVALSETAIHNKASDSEVMLETQVTTGELQFGRDVLSAGHISVVSFY